MKVIRFAAGASTSYGALTGDTIQIWTAAPWMSGTPTGKSVSLREVKLLAPCEPAKIIGVAINFPGATGLSSEITEPLVFLKPSTSLIGPGDTIVAPFPDMRIWGESELGIVIGKRLSRCTKEESAEGVFGYTIGNDVSADNLFAWDHHLARSKGADTFSVLGPWIDTDFDPRGKKIRGFHNNVLLREGLASERVWKEPALVAWLSGWMTLEPGDVILTGAPTRVRDRLYLADGDTFTCAIDGLGELKNPFRSVAAR